MSEPKLLAAITIGQAPRTDVTADILPMLPPHVTLREYGALDELTWEQVMDAFHPAPGEQVLVSRMRDGRQVRMTEGYVLPRLQAEMVNPDHRVPPCRARRPGSVLPIGAPTSGGHGHSF